MSLRKYAVAPAPEAPARVERCELCREELDDRHGHLVDVQERSIACACRPCYLLFTAAGAGRFRAIPDRYRKGDPVTAEEWAALGIPVDTAFFFTNSELDRVVAYYPSPAGATECQLDVALDHPLLTVAEPDVEAVLIHRLETFLVPVDACYRLVGQLRLDWHGFDGGSEVRNALNAFVENLRERGKPWSR